MRGAWPCWARAARVRDDPKIDEFPTDRTAIKMTTFITEGRIFIPALLMAMTKGEDLASSELVPISLLSPYGTNKLTMVNATM